MAHSIANNLTDLSELGLQLDQNDNVSEIIVKYNLWIYRNLLLNILLRWL
jgi:hypothetical protein